MGLATQKKGGDVDTTEEEGEWTEPNSSQAHKPDLGASGVHPLLQEIFDAGASVLPDAEIERIQHERATRESGSSSDVSSQEEIDFLFALMEMLKYAVLEAKKESTKPVVEPRSRAGGSIATVLISWILDFVACVTCLWSRNILHVLKWEATCKQLAPFCSRSSL